MSLKVPNFVLKNKFDYSNGAPVKQLNEASWRYLYENKENNTNTPESTNDPNYKKQLPWLTLYKTHKDLLQIKLVTTVAYVETTHDPNDPDYRIEAAYIKGFPLMLAEVEIKGIFISSINALQKLSLTNLIAIDSFFPYKI